MTESVVDVQRMPERGLTEAQKRGSSLLWFSEIDSSHLGVAGGKGANLGEMIRRGAPVPPGFVVSVVAYRRFLAGSGLDVKLGEILSSFNIYRTSVLLDVAARAQQAILDAPMPPELADEIVEAYRALGEGPVAVRSSATAEDLPDASFAGQQRTYLNVEGIDQVLETVKGCWASLFEAARHLLPRGEEFRPAQRRHRRRRAAHGAVGGLRRHVHRRAAPQRPLQGAYRGRLRAGRSRRFGRGHADSYLLRKDGLQIIEKRLVPQSRMLIRNPNASGAEDLNHEVDVPAGLEHAYKLDDDRIAEIARYGLSLEEAYNHPQDIEWAMEGGAFYVTQTRPITTLSSFGEVKGLEVDESAHPLLVQGTAASPGSAAGPVVVVPKIDEDTLHLLDLVKPGDVLVTEMTTPDYVPAMKRAAAIVTDHGGRTAHAAIISRELSIPCVVGAGTATAALADGRTVTVDGATGLVYDGAVPGAGEETNEDDAAANLSTETAVYVNLAEPDLADVIAARNVDGVGLLRAEFIVARIGEHPRLMIEEGRREEYVRRIADNLLKFAAAFDPPPGHLPHDGLQDERVPQPARRRPLRARGREPDDRLSRGRAVHPGAGHLRAGNRGRAPRPRPAPEPARHDSLRPHRR